MQIFISFFLYTRKIRTSYTGILRFVINVLVSRVSCLMAGIYKIIIFYFFWGELTSEWKYMRVSIGESEASIRWALTAQFHGRGLPRLLCVCVRARRHYIAIRRIIFPVRCPLSLSRSPLSYFTVFFFYIFCFVFFSFRSLYSARLDLPTSHSEIGHFSPNFLNHFCGWGEKKKKNTFELEKKAFDSIYRI